MEILAVDKGPGMADVARCLADGYSSAKTSGTGLGAIARMSSDFDVHSDVKRGTVLVARLQRPPASGKLLHASSVGAVLKPIAGEEVSGDCWAVCESANTLGLLVADGLGHGEMAARASTEAVAAYRRQADWSPRAALEQIHAALRSTRGAAVGCQGATRVTPPSSLELKPILSVNIQQEQDVVTARQRARQLSALLGFAQQDQTRIATAV